MVPEPQCVKHCFMRNEDGMKTEKDTLGNSHTVVYHSFGRQEVMSSNPKCISQNTVAELNGKVLKRALGSFFHSLTRQLFILYVPSVCCERSRDSQTLKHSQPCQSDKMSRSNHQNAGAVASAIGDRSQVWARQSGTDSRGAPKIP